MSFHPCHGQLDPVLIRFTGFGKALAVVQMKCMRVSLIACQGHFVRSTEWLGPDIIQHPLQCVAAIALSLPGLIDHHMLTIIFRNVIIADHHDISDHGVISIVISMNTEELALVSVNICLCQAANGMRYAGLLTRSQLEI